MGLKSWVLKKVLAETEKSLVVSNANLEKARSLVVDAKASLEKVEILNVKCEKLVENGERLVRKIQNEMGIPTEKQCPACGGSGRGIDDICGFCGGDGTVGIEASL